MNDSVHIYALCEPDSPDDVRCIGKSTNPWSRYDTHRRLADGSIAKRTWIRQLRAEGKAPLLRILQTTDVEHAHEAEIEQARSHIQKGCNLTNGLGPLGLTSHTFSNATVKHTPTLLRRSDEGWQLPLRLPEEWRGPLQDLGNRYAEPARRKPSIADTVREALRRSLMNEGLLEDRRKADKDE